MNSPTSLQLVIVPHRKNPLWLVVQGVVQGGELTVAGKAWVTNLFLVHDWRTVTFPQILVNQKVEILGWTQVQALSI